MRRNGVRWLAWWYLTICVGFVLLTIVHVITRDKPWLIGIRLVIAAGFGILSSFEFRGNRQNR